MALALFFWGVAVCLYFGRLALVPLDQSVVFDGGWRVACGQVPFRDFHPLTGLTPVLAQAVVFQLCGVSWWSYCLHAALFNGAFCLLTVWVLRHLGAPRWLGWSAGALTALAYYPPIGTPYMEQHGFAASLVAVALLLAGRDARHSGMRRLYWAAVPTAVWLTFFCKQNVVLFFGPVVLWLGWAVARESGRLRELLLAWAAGSAFIILTSAGLAAGLGVHWESFWNYTVVLASAVGADRVGPSTARIFLFSTVPGGTALALGTWLGAFLVRHLGRHGGRAVLGLGFGLAMLFAVGAIASSSGALISRAPAWFVDWLHPLGRRLAGLGFLLGLWVGGGHGWASGEGIPRPWQLAAAWASATYGFAGLTANQPINSFGFNFLLAGLVVTPWLIESKWTFGRRMMAVALVVLVAADAGLFLLTDEGRWVHDQRARRSEAVACETPALRFLLFTVPKPSVGPTARELDQLVRELRSGPGEFFLVGDSTFLYGAVGQPSLGSELWFHSAMRSAFYRDHLQAAYELGLLAEFQRRNVRRVVLEGEHTFTGMALADFPRLHAEVERRRTTERRIGSYRIIELGPDQGP
jgi:hypothetical protein